MTLYYYETPGTSGKFYAENDEVARHRWAERALIIYKEASTPTGRPFVVVHERHSSQDR